jgi:hypothetical protein
MWESHIVCRTVSPSCREVNRTIGTNGPLSNESLLMKNDFAFLDVGANAIARDEFPFQQGQTQRIQ